MPKFEIGRKVRITNRNYLSNNFLPMNTQGTIKDIDKYHGVYQRNIATVELVDGSKRILRIFEDTFEYVNDEPTTGAITKATTANPKDLLGAKKVPLGQVCPVAMAHESCAMLDGDLKYGFRNWRQKDVQARIYLDAALRHLQSWAEGEETAQDSGVHHLGHARACLGILLDAQENGNLIDDRATGVFSRVSDRLSAWVVERVKKETDKATSEPTKQDFVNQWDEQYGHMVRQIV